MARRHRELPLEKEDKSALGVRRRGPQQHLRPASDLITAKLRNARTHTTRTHCTHAIVTHIRHCYNNYSTCDRARSDSRCLGYVDIGQGATGSIWVYF